MKDRAKKIIESVPYITLATCSKKGIPWNSPLWAVHDSDFTFYWNSPIAAVHSNNIIQNPSVFIVIFDTNQPEGTGEAVYIEAKAYELSDEDEINRAAAIFYKGKGKSPKPASDFLRKEPRRMYKAVPQKFWMNTDEKVNGHHLDGRKEVKLRTT